MPTKIIGTITSCIECDSVKEKRYYFRDKPKHYCSLMDDELDNIWDIPVWCPLEEYDE